MRVCVSVCVSAYVRECDLLGTDGIEVVRRDEAGASEVVLVEGVERGAGRVREEGKGSVSLLCGNVCGCVNPHVSVCSMTCEGVDVCVRACVTVCVCDSDRVRACLFVSVCTRVCVCACVRAYF